MRYWNRVEMYAYLVSRRMKEWEEMFSFVDHNRTKGIAICTRRLGVGNNIPILLGVGQCPWVDMVLFCFGYGILS